MCEIMLCCTPELVFDVELEIFVVVVIELFLPEREKHRSVGWLAGWCAIAKKCNTKNKIKTKSWSAKCNRVNCFRTHNVKFYT